MMRTVFFMTGIALAISCSMVVEAARAGGDGLLFDPPQRTEQDRNSDQTSTVDIFPGNEDRMTWEEVLQNMSLPAENARSYSRIPTYDGSGQCVHPDIMYFPDGWNGFRYWMALTPYPNSRDSYENPSIVVSNDNANWTAPVQNPLDSPPSGSHNSDTEWIYVPNEDRVHLLYRRGEWELYVLSSPNGLDWNGERVQVFNGERSNCCLSPAVVYEGKGSFRMWMVNGIGSPNTLMTYSKQGSPVGPWEYEKNCTIENIPDGRDLWHIDVIRCAGGKFYLAIIVLADMNKTINTTLHLGLSSDGVKWTISERELVKASKRSWDNDMIYRSSSAVLSGEGKDRLGIWYSARSSSGSWHIGYTELGINISWIAQRTVPYEKPAYIPNSTDPRSYYDGGSFSDTMSDSINGSVPEPVADDPASKSTRDDVSRNGSSNIVPDLPELSDTSCIVPGQDTKGNDTSGSDSKGTPTNSSRGSTPNNNSKVPMDISSPDNTSDHDGGLFPNRGDGDSGEEAEAPSSIGIGGKKDGFPVPGFVFLTVVLSLISLTGISLDPSGKRSCQCR